MNNELFSKTECIKWKNARKNGNKCCSDPDIRCFSIQERSKDEMSTFYKICMHCNKKIKMSNNN